ncbi:MAG TPA: SMI1/KNR4 family protein [Gallionellaceae bacterium]|jgi:hypothetical protein|nr:SMI1/KNR4 family protein [Gallionellaceae bacterium]
MYTITELFEIFKPVLLGTKQESDTSLQRVESSLDVTLPQDVKWFLTICGYGPTNAIPNINMSVPYTERFRSAVNLPHNYIVIDDRNDGGAVILDTNSHFGAVLWVDTHVLHKLGNEPLSATEADVFPSFVSWVMYCIEDVADESTA